MRSATVGAPVDGVGPRWWCWTSSRSRTAAMAVAAAVGTVATGTWGSWVYAPLVGWDAAALLFVVWVWTGVVGRMSSSETAAHATREDPGTAATDVFVVTAALASLVAVAVILMRATSAHAATRDLLAAAGVLSVALTWFSVHTLFTLKYARLFHHGAPGGVDFNQPNPPRYLDFAYLAFTIGMTFQVSDTSISSPAIRATALRHALLSYLFGAVILATTINLIAGLSTGGG